MISLILSGGVGSRLWPVSREKLPKQFSPIFGKSLFVQTMERLLEFGPVQVCTSEKLKGLTESSLRQNGISADKLFYEPEGRNTAPAIALACKAMRDDGRSQEIMGVFPSDHWVSRQAEFSKVVDLANQCAEKGQIVTIGITPSFPATGFGYIEVGKETFAEANGYKAHQALRFKEKPDLKTAQSYIDSQQFVWNSGMFVFKVQSMIEAFETCMPEMWNGLQELKKDLSNLDQVFPTLQKESIDFGVMEKINNHVNIPCDIGWSDLGSWDDISDIEKSQLNQSGQSVEVQAKNNFFFSDENKMAAFSAVEDLIVVDTKDALLITKKTRSQTVKDVFSQLQQSNPTLTIDHQFEYRPWGLYQNLYEEESFKTKVITVDPGQQLSYQSHAQRAETWVIVEGQGEVVLNGETIPVQPSTVVQIPVGAKHRMRNTGTRVLKFVEVQQGEYFGEDDIVRYEDDYSRK